MTEALIKVLNMSITASYVAIFVILARLILKKAPKSFSYALWSTVLFRLLSSASLKSTLSFLRPLNSNSNYIPSNIEMMKIPEINTNIAAIDNVINNSLPAAIPYTSINPMQVYMFILTIVWVIGILVLITFSVFSYVNIRKKVQFATLIKDNIYESDQIKSPFVLGIIKPRIYLPIGLKNEELEYIVKHENIHIKRRDYIIKPIAFLALILHWFNPVIWLSYFLMIKDMEMSCDERVMKESDNDIRGNYSNTMLSLAVKQSNLFIPLAFGESNIKSRIKNIIRYKKSGFWAIVIAIIIVILIMMGLLTNPLTNSPEARAKEFLKTYYTIDNTDIVDLMYDLIDDYANTNTTTGIGVIEVEGFEEALKSKYGDFMTEKELKRASANRTILIGEMAAKKNDSTMSIEHVNIWDEKTSDNGDITYEYNIPAIVRFKNGNQESVNLFGSLVMKNVDKVWKVNYFNPIMNDIEKIMQYGKSYVNINIESNTPIRIIEIDRKGKPEGAINADNSEMEKGDKFSFEMLDENSLDFTIKLLDEDRNILAEQDFIKDFSEGKDVELFIQEDNNGKLIIGDRKPESINIIGGADGPTSILVSDVVLKEPIIDITSRISNITDEEFSGIGTTGIENPTKEDFRKFTFKLYVEHGKDIKNRTIIVPEYYSLFKGNNDIYWFGGNSSQDNENENFAQYTYDIMLFTRNLSNEDLIEILNTSDINISWKRDGQDYHRSYKVGDLTIFN